MGIGCKWSSEILLGGGDENIPKLVYGDGCITQLKWVNFMIRNM